MNKIGEIVMNFIRGFCMALADSVPGVSGGTIAFLLGFYDKFVNSLAHIIKGTKQERKDAIIFLIKIGIGWVIGFLMAVSILASIFDEKIYEVSSLFIGFIIFAIPVVIMEEKDSFKGKYKNIIFTILGIAFVLGITLINPSTNGEVALDLANLNLGTGIYLFLVAMVAISAMILPGISGSTLLLIFGLYMPVISAIKELLHFQFAYLPAVIIFGLGILTGIILIIKLVQKCLEKFRSQTMYFIIGMMMASLYSIVVGPTTLDLPQPAMNFSTFSIIFFIIGGAIIVALQVLKNLMSKKNKE